MRFTIPLCLFNRHRPDRADIDWDGLNYLSTCRHCGAAIRRKAHHRWLRDWNPEPLTAGL